MQQSPIVVTITLPAWTEEQAQRLAAQAAEMFAEAEVAIVKNEIPPEPPKVVTPPAPVAIAESQPAEIEIEIAPGVVIGKAQARDRESGIVVRLVGSAEDYVTLQQIDEATGENIGVPYSCPTEFFLSGYEILSAEEIAARKPAARVTPRAPAAPTASQPGDVIEIAPRVSVTIGETTATDGESEIFVLVISEANGLLTLQPIDPMSGERTAPAYACPFAAFAKFYQITLRKKKAEADSVSNDTAKSDAAAEGSKKKRRVKPAAKKKTFSKKRARSRKK